MDPGRRAKTRVQDELPGAGDESRTRDLNLGKVALYQLSYSRFLTTLHSRSQGAHHKIEHARRDVLP